MPITPLMLFKRDQRRAVARGSAAPPPSPASGRNPNAPDEEEPYKELEWPLVKRILAPTIGRGLLSSDGELWRAQRKIVAASFTPPAVDALVPVFADVGQRMARSWESGTRDMAIEATTATMTVISQALFSGDPTM